MGSPPASHQYNVRVCPIKTHDVAVFCGVDHYTSSLGNILRDGRLLHNRSTDFDARCRRSLGLMPAAQSYMVPLGWIKTPEIAVCGRGGISYQSGNIVLYGRLLHDRETDHGPLCRRLLGSAPASQWYKVHPTTTFIHDVTGSQLGGVTRSQSLRRGFNLYMNWYFFTRFRLLMSMGVSICISLYIRTIVIVK